MGVLLKDKSIITITDAFQENSNESGRKPNKISSVDKDSECYNKPLKLWLKNSNVEIHSIHN